jgi:hypothetical protein
MVRYPCLTIKFNILHQFACWFLYHDNSTQRCVYSKVDSTAKVKLKSVLFQECFLWTRVKSYSILSCSHCTFSWVTIKIMTWWPTCSVCWTVGCCVIRAFPLQLHGGHEALGFKTEARVSTTPLCCGKEGNCSFHNEIVPFLELVESITRIESWNEALY